VDEYLWLASELRICLSALIPLDVPQKGYPAYELKTT